MGILRGFMDTLMFLLRNTTTPWYAPFPATYAVAGFLFTSFALGF